MSRNRRRLSVQTLETRKLMAGDAFGVTGVDDPTIDGDQSTAVISDPGFGITQPGIIAKPSEPVFRYNANTKEITFDASTGDGGTATYDGAGQTLMWAENIN